MSKQGVKKVAKILSDMQQLRVVLLKDITDHQDVLLGQLLETSKDCIKEDFARIAAGMYPKEIGGEISRPRKRRRERSLNDPLVLG